MRSALSVSTLVLALTLFTSFVFPDHSRAANDLGSTQVSTNPGPTNNDAPPLPLRKPTLSLDSLRARLDHDDRLIAMRALHLALSQVPDGGTFVWRKRSRNLKGLIKPTNAFRNERGQVCRNVIYALSLGRYLKQIKGVACRDEDGSWRL